MKIWKIWPSCKFSPITQNSVYQHQPNSLTFSHICVTCYDLLGNKSHGQVSQASVVASHGRNSFLSLLCKCHLQARCTCLCGSTPLRLTAECKWYRHGQGVAFMWCQYRSLEQTCLPCQNWDKYGRKYTFAVTSLPTPI